MADSALNRETVVLAGDPVRAGAVYGRVTGACTRRYLQDFLLATRAAGVSGSELRRRTDRCRTVIDRLSPWWHGEMASIADAAGVDMDAYSAYVAQKYVIRTPQRAGHECTSFLAAGRAAAAGMSLLHKNRDSHPRAQGLWIRALDGCFRYLGGGDAGDYGVIHFVNERGLAGVMNAGSPNPDAADQGLPTPLILQFIAERAADCRDALAIVQDVVGRGWYTNGADGSLWLFADPRRGLVVENTARRLDYAWIEDTVCVRANDFLLPGTRAYARAHSDTNPRYATARKALSARGGPVTARMMNTLSRDNSSAGEVICGARTLSGFTAELTGRLPDMLSMAWVALGHPNNAPYVPYYVGARGLPAFLVDGSLWTLAAELHAFNPAIPNPRLAADAFEEALERERHSLEAELMRLLVAGRREKAADYLTTRATDWAVRAADALAATGLRASDRA